MAANEDGQIDTVTNVPLGYKLANSRLTKRVADLEAQLSQAEEANNKLYKVNQRIAAELDRQNAVNTRLTAELSKALDKVALQAKQTRNNIDSNIEKLMDAAKKFSQAHVVVYDELGESYIDIDPQAWFEFDTAFGLVVEPRAALDRDIAASQAAGVKFNTWTPEKRAQAEAMQEEADA